MLLTESSGFIEIRVVENNLVLKQMWDGQEFTFVPQSPIEFNAKVGRFPLKFTKDNNGIATEVLGFNRDLWIRMKD